MVQIATKTYNSYGHWDSFLDFVSLDKLVHPMIHSCLLSKSALSDYIDSKSKKTLKRIRHQVKKQIHAISVNLRTLVSHELLA